MKSSRCAVFISGRGSNLSVFLDVHENLDLGLVVSNRKDAYGLARARRMGIPLLILDSPVSWEYLQSELERHHIHGVFLAGFMKILPPEFLSHWQGNIFNVHPSLLPKYKGLKSLRRAYDDGEAVGVSVHRVTPAVDDGEVLFQETAVCKNEVGTLRFADVEFRAHCTEHKLVRKWIEKWPQLLTS